MIEEILVFSSPFITMISVSLPIWWFASGRYNHGKYKGKTPVDIHDNCGGYLAFTEYNAGYQRRCLKCGASEEAWFGMGKRLSYHEEWRPKEEVAKVFDD